MSDIDQPHYRDLQPPKKTEKEHSEQASKNPLAGLIEQRKEREQRAKAIADDQMKNMKTNLDLLLISEKEVDRKFVKSMKDATTAKDVLGVARSLLQRLEQEIPSLGYDQPGWDGNALAMLGLVDGERAPQWGCDFEATFLCTALQHLQREGILSRAMRFSVENTSTWEEIIGKQSGHTALMLYERDARIPSGVLDAWLAKPGESLPVFLDEAKPANGNVLKQWMKSVNAFSEKEKQERAVFDKQNRMSPEMIRSVGGFLVGQTQGKFEIMVMNEDTVLQDYLFQKYFRQKNSPLREMVNPVFFRIMRDKIGFALERRKMLSPEEKKNLQACEQLQQLQPFIDRYYDTFYPQQ